MLLCISCVSLCYFSTCTYLLDVLYCNYIEFQHFLFMTASDYCSILLLLIILSRNRNARSTNVDRIRKFFNLLRLFTRMIFDQATAALKWNNQLINKSSIIFSCFFFGKATLFTFNVLLIGLCTFESNLVFKRWWKIIIHAHRINTKALCWNCIRCPFS